MNRYYLFGIVPANCRINLDISDITELPGLHLEKIDLEPAGVISAIAAPIPDHLVAWLEAVLEEPTKVPELLIGHDAIVRMIFGQSDILPCRFGTIIASQEALEQWLADNHTTLTHRLQMLREAGEWSIRVAGKTPATAQPETEDSSEPESSPHTSPTGVNTTLPANTSPKAAFRSAVSHGQDLTEGGRGFLRAKLASRKARDRLRSSRSQTIQHLHENATAIARDFRTASDQNKRPGDLFKSSYLVPIDGRSDFQALVREQQSKADDLGLIVTVDGPLPPYSFIADTGAKPHA